MRNAGVLASVWGLLGTTRPSGSGRSFNPDGAYHGKTKEQKRKRKTQKLARRANRRK